MLQLKRHILIIIMILASLQVLKTQFGPKFSQPDIP